MTAVPRNEAALQAASRGNHVRAALIVARESSVEAGAAALGPLWADLVATLALGPEEAARLPELGAALLAVAARARLSPEANVLFGLQTLTVDERREEPYEYVEWLRTVGSMKFDRPRPLSRLVTKFRRLTSLITRLRKVQIGAPHAQAAEALARTLEGPRDRVKAAAFGDIRAILNRHLGRSQLSGPPEARERIIEQLLQRIERWGATDFGDLRDAIATNALKMEDLGAKDLSGDALIQLDTQLARELDGVHHRGEFYLRFLHRVQSLLFGTKVGRVVSRFFLGPLAASEILLHFVEFIAEQFKDNLKLASPLNVLLVGVVLSLLVNVPVLWNGLKAVGRWMIRPITHRPHQPDARPGPFRRAFRWVVRVYQDTIDRIDSAFYVVEEWVRFRGGDRRGARSLEGLAALAVFAVSYVLRFAFRLVIEPTFNPIKHFPMVTVAGKISIASGLPIFLTQSLADAMPTSIATTLATLIAVFFIPGLAGFLAWEIRSNWRLYRANA